MEFSSLEDACSCLQTRWFHPSSLSALNSSLARLVCERECVRERGSERAREREITRGCAQTLWFHPLHNDKSTAISATDLVK